MTQSKKVRHDGWVVQVKLLDGPWMTLNETNCETKYRALRLKHGKLKDVWLLPMRVVKFKFVEVGDE